MRSSIFSAGLFFGFLAGWIWQDIRPFGVGWLQYNLNELVMRVDRNLADV